MSLAAGARLGPYEIVAPLGAGGMGEIWRARDTRLSREVAIKILPAEVAADPGRLKRFEKEARSASALNHPNIVTIYDIGSADSISYIAMERVDGKTLRELLLAGALPLKKVLQIATQIADGLARAHEAGIVHRDLKPENVMVTKDGLVKILDFGLAKLTQAESGSGEVSHLPTETGTSPGTVLGTVAYMSPEQASAHSVDFRSDQFSFGSLLYEMATGKRAFQGKTAVSSRQDSPREDPRLSTFPARTSSRSPLAERWQSLWTGRSHASHWQAAGHDRSGGRLLGRLGAGRSSLAVVHRSGRTQRLEYPIGKVLYETSGSLRYCRVSPRGDTVAFLDLPLLGSERGSVAIVNRTGKRTVLSTDWNELQTLAWSPKGTEVWFTGHKPGSTGGIWAVSLSGKLRLVSQEGGAIEDIDPRHRALVTRNIPRGGISGLAPGERQERDLSWFDFSNARDLSSDGRTLLFEETGDGVVSPYHDVYIRKMDGSPAVRLGEGEAYSFSPDGKWVLSLVDSTPPRLELIPTGTGETRALPRGPIVKYGLSGWFPDGKRIFLTGFETAGESRVYFQDVSGGPPHPLTPEGFSAQAAVSPDGGSLVVRGSDRTCWIFPTGGGEPRSISGIQPTDRPIRFSDDGAALYVERNLRASAQIHRIDLRSGRWSLFKEIVAADPAGLDWIGGFRLTPDASAYVYSYSRVPSDLYLAEGLK